MTGPIVSIVIPAYNHADYLAGAVESVLAQDFTATQLIIVDDGSTDNTPEVLAELQTTYGTERVYVIHQENAGQAKALEVGWATASGSILGYLSADDGLDPTAVSHSVQILETNPKAVAVYCNFRLIDPAGRTIRTIVAPDFDIRKLIGDVQCLPGPGAFFRRDAYLATGPWNPAYRQMPDYDFWLRLCIKGPFVHLDEALASFRVHEESQTYAAATPQQAAEPFTIIQRFFERQDLPDEVRGLETRSKANAHLLSAQLHFRAGRAGPGLLNTGLGLRHYPKLLIERRFYRLLLNAAFNRRAHQILWMLRSVIGRDRRA
ncbi:glycosyltransferase [uncultured Roseobacter sp.]|uniref:glycosyltransferase n=1 Tax=uncultured Roseobacter sp. TaxID=114847 RepID=UPI00262837F0|nr:glycosyltransferase [uncultured Roseobacter sp.]